MFSRRPHSSTQLQKRSFHVIERTRTSSKCRKMKRCTCKNTFLHCQICKFLGVLLPSSSWLLKLPTDTALRTVDWSLLNMTNHMTRQRRSALYGDGIVGAYFQLIFNTHISFQSCNRRSTIDIRRYPRQHFLK